MPQWRKLFLAVNSAVAFGLSGTALAQTPNMHTMTVQLPGGGVAEIQYTGNVPPLVTVSAGPAATGAFMPTASLFGTNSPFAMLDRISAEMDREAAALFRYADALAVQPSPGASVLTLTNLQNLRPGTRSFSYVSTVSGNSVCTHSTEITATDNGPPRVVTHSSGNCPPEMNPPGSAGWSAPTTPKQPDMIWTKNEAAAQPHVTMIRDAGLHR